MAGGLVVTWKEGVNVQILNHDTFFIHFIIESQQEGRKWEVIGVYLHTDEAGRDEQYPKLRQIMAHEGDQVVLIGDFNVIRAHHEKEGGRAKSAGSIQKFNDFINAGGLVDMGFEGDKFTWNNRQFGDNCIQERLDRALVSLAWRSEFFDAFVKHLDDSGSDHKALLLCSHKKERRSKRRFRFQERWCEKEEVGNIIKQAWRLEVVGSAMFKLAGKLKSCRHKLVEWQRTSNSNSNSKIMSLKEKISNETNKGQLANGATIRILEAKLEEACEQEERYWREKSEYNG